MVYKNINAYEILKKNNYYLSSRFGFNQSELIVEFFLLNFPRFK